MGVVALLEDNFGLITMYVLEICVDLGKCDKGYDFICFLSNEFESCQEL